jgi:hypothetical protein
MRIGDPESFDPGWDGKNSDPGSGINILDPEHWKKAGSTCTGIYCIERRGKTHLCPILHVAINCFVQVCLPRDHREGNTAVPAGGGRRTEAPPAAAAAPAAVPAPAAPAAAAAIPAAPPGAPAVPGLPTGHRGRPVLHQYSR